MNNVFQKPLHSFRIFPNVSMKYFSMNVEKTLLYRACITKRPRDMKALGRYLNKEIWHSQVIWISRTFRECGLLPEKQMGSHCSIMHIFEKTLKPIKMQRHGPIIWVKPNWTSFDIYTQFIYQRHHHRLESWNLFFVQPPVMDHRTIMHFRKIIIYNSFWGIPAMNCR